jgi:hypothetical protein
MQNLVKLYAIPFMRLHYWPEDGLLTSKRVAKLKT